MKKSRSDLLAGDMKKSRKKRTTKKPVKWQFQIRLDNDRRTKIDQIVKHMQASISHEITDRCKAIRQMIDDYEVSA